MITNLTTTIGDLLSSLSNNTQIHFCVSSGFTITSDTLIINNVLDISSKISQLNFVAKSNSVMVNEFKTFTQKIVEI